MATVKQKYFSKSFQYPKTLILLTDGGDTRLENLEKKKMEEEIIKIADMFPKGMHFRFIVVGIGSKIPGEIPGVTYKDQPVASKVEEGILKGLSKKSGVKYYFAGDFSVLELASRITFDLKREGEILQEETKGSLEYDRYFQIPLMCAMLFLVFYLLFPEMKKRKIK